MTTSDDSFRSVFSPHITFFCGLIRYSFPVLFRLYQSGDFDSLYAIEEICFQPPLRFPRRYMRELVASPDAATWIAEADGRMAGFAIVEWSRAEGETQAYIQTLEVDPEQRRKGLGAELLRRLETSARAAGAALIWLHVDAQNSSAIQLYEAHGYEHQGREENYYAGKRDALIYVKAFR